jgi:hypothetical protein
VTRRQALAGVRVAWSGIGFLGVPFGTELLAGGDDAATGVSSAGSTVGLVYSEPWERSLPDLDDDHVHHEPWDEIGGSPTEQRDSTTSHSARRPGDASAAREGRR